MDMESFAVSSVLFLWCALPVGAIGCLFWAALATPRRKRIAATTALCLWCAVAGGALSGSLWSWMTSTNWQHQATQLARLAPGAPPINAERDSMGMLKFFVHLDRFFRRFLYATVLLPLVGSIFLFRRAAQIPPPMAKPPIHDDEFSSSFP